MMIWVQRLVGLAFLIGLAALGAGVFAIVRQAEGVPPLPIFVGLVCAIMLVLLAGACLALMSIAVSARQAAEALQRQAALGGAALTAPVATATGPFSATGLKETAPPPSTARPSGRMLVAER
ncbi:hypothetical protein [Paracoccus sp. (in: a-proteobacteria)]|uniref:hypothetical protein n=1 Tax=Paracoccus sp. TaxID=267 RepID=UPI003A8997AF